MTGPADSIIGHALQGLNRALDKADGAARRIAETGTAAEPVTDLITAEHEVRANAAVIRTADETQKHLIDILA